MGPSRDLAEMRLPTVICLIVTTLAAAPVAADEIVWHTSYKNAAEEAERLGRPLLLNLWFERCRVCLEMEESFWVRQDVVEMANRFVCVKVDIARSRHLQRIYQAWDLPMILLTSAGGTELLRAQGYPGPEPLLKIMSVIADNYEDLELFAERVAENDKDGIALVRLGHFFYEQGFFTVSNDFYRRALRSPDAREDPQLEAEVLVAVGWNHLRLAGQLTDRDQALAYYSDALKNFRQYLAMDVEVERPDVALFGQIICHLARGEIDEATEIFSRLETRYPDSEATAQARRRIERVTGGS
jgi:tetratricopeptide (TPR) repeat protein